MRLAYVVQRYGEEVAGGAELHCREFAERLAQRGHDVSVFTTCARSYVDWADEYEPGATCLNGVRVLRFGVDHPRYNRLFGDLDARVSWGRKPIALCAQREWMRLQGPAVSTLFQQLTRRAPTYDVVVFFTYLYNTTWQGLRAVAGRTRTVLHPTVHDEAPAYLSMFRTLFRLPDALALSTEEELAFIRRRYGFEPRHEIVGIGVDLDLGGDTTGFRTTFGLGEMPYLACVGRLDPGKGTDHLYDYFVAYKKRHRLPLKLVLVGDPVAPVPEHPDVICTGYVSSTVRNAAIAGALALVQPSYYESFSMVLTEAFSLGRPALVQGHCAVLDGHARRSGAAVPYRGYGEFEAALDLLVEDSALASRLGDAGRRYVQSRYRWDHVLDRYERMLESVAQ